MKNQVLPADTFVVVNKTLLYEENHKILTLLYQPIVGNIASSLYLTLEMLLDQSKIMSQQWTHHTLMTNLSLNLDFIIEAREKLEALGLLKVYRKKEGITHYIYELYSPLEASQFLENPLLNTLLRHTIGEESYKHILEYVTIPPIHKEGYQDITCRFSDVYAVTPNSQFDASLLQLKKSQYSQLSVFSKIDLNGLLELIPDEVLMKKSITKDMREFLYLLSFVYDFKERDLETLIMSSLNEKKVIDKALMKKNAQKYYQFEHKGNMPTLIDKRQPEFLRKANGNTKRDKMIYTFETTSPYDFLKSKNGGTPTSVETDLLLYLLDELKLPNGVVNVLIDYVLRINKNKLNKAFVLTIAAQWQREKIETVPDAMELAEQEYKRRKTSGNKTVGRKQVVETPNWLNQDIETSEVTAQEQAQLEQLRKKYQGGKG